MRVVSHDLLAFLNHQMTMKIEIEISEETAACIWADEWGEKTGQSVAFYLKNLVESQADQYRKMFPNDVATAVERFREANDQGDSRRDGSPSQLDGLSPSMSTALFEGGQLPEK